MFHLYNAVDLSGRARYDECMALVMIHQGPNTPKIGQLLEFTSLVERLAKIIPPIFNFVAKK